jgi:hypothetical protein
MIKRIIAKVFKLGGGHQFWAEDLERKERIKQIDHQFKLLKEGLAARQDQEFLIYALAKFLLLHKKQQKLLINNL